MIELKEDVISTTLSENKIDVSVTSSEISVDIASKGTPGEGVATGGTTGQSLVKTSSTNYDTEWSNRENPLTFSTGLVRSTNTITANIIDNTIGVTNLWSSKKISEAAREIEVFHSAESLTQAQVYTLVNPFLKGNDKLMMSGAFMSSEFGNLMIVSYCERTSADSITIYGLLFDGRVVSTVAKDKENLNCCEGGSISFKTGGE